MSVKIEISITLAEPSFHEGELEVCPDFYEEENSLKKIYTRVNNVLPSITLSF